MSEEFDLNISELRKRRAEGESSSSNGNGERTRSEDRARPGIGPERILLGSRIESMSSHHSEPSPLNPWRVLEILTRYWRWLAIGAGVCGFLAFCLGVSITRHSVGVTLLRRETQNAFTGGIDPSQTKELAQLTLFKMMAAPEVIRGVVTNAVLYPITPGELARSVRVVPDRDPEFVNIYISAKASGSALVYWANLYGQQVTNYMRKVQMDESAFAKDVLQKQLERVEQEMTGVSTVMAKFSRDAEVVDFDKALDAFVQNLFTIDTKRDSARFEQTRIQSKIDALHNALTQQGGVNDKLQAAQEQLQELLREYKEAHYRVIQQRAYIADLTNRTTIASTNVLATQSPGGSFANAIYLQIVELNAEKQSFAAEVARLDEQKTLIRSQAKGFSEKAVEYAILKGRYKSLEAQRTSYEEKQRQAQSIHDNALGYFRVYSWATPGQVNVRKRWVSVFFLTVVGGVLGALTAALVALIAEVAEGRIKTVADLRRITRLPVLGTLGDLRDMSPSEQVSWAFRALTVLQGKLNTSTDQTLVCGFISSQHGEGRSTWINLLVSAASQRGMRVLTVATRPANAPAPQPEPVPVAGLLPPQPSTTLSTNVLTMPAQVASKLSWHTDLFAESGAPQAMECCPGALVTNRESSAAR